MRLQFLVSGRRKQLCRQFALWSSDMICCLCEISQLFAPEKMTGCPQKNMSKSTYTNYGQYAAISDLNILIRGQRYIVGLWGITVFWHFSEQSGGEKGEHGECP